MNGPPGAFWWRRRFLRVALVISVIWIGFGVLFGVLARDGDRGRDGPPGSPPVLVVAIVGAAVIATFIAYRRLARPVSELLDGAEQLGGGDYDARVYPAGPRAVRTLGRAFNDMAGRLEESEDARRRFLADITHELRTPLTVLQGEVEAQLDGIHPRDDAHLTTLLDQTRTLDRLVEDLRTLALGDAGQLTLHREAVSVAAIVDDAVAAIAPIAAGRGVTITTARAAESDVELLADPVRLGQVVTNLLTNAVRHTPRAGTVAITAAAAGDAVTVTVADTGSGIEGDPERVFDRFSRTADSGGSGLGLTIARQLVERHGGTLTAANEPTGGARFTVTLPRVSS
ncbi:MAG: ATP-binding protein [Actinomycetota bacterium]|nr:ATP-binding protein [Actinomycetota bacterium]